MCAFHRFQGIIDSKFWVSSPIDPVLLRCEIKISRRRLFKVGDHLQATADNEMTLDLPQVDFLYYGIEIGQRDTASQGEKVRLTGLNENGL